MIEPVDGGSTAQVILVDSTDVAIGLGDKMRVHRTGALHRAFSIFVFNSQGDLLLQRRARAKYHSGGLWSNTCCSHPRPGVELEADARRRLAEEMGIACALRWRCRFTYEAKLDNGLVEHEIDHVFTAQWNGVPHPDPSEVDSWRWCSTDSLVRELHDRPQEFTAWLPLALSELSASP